VFANISIFAPPSTQANRRAAVAQRRYATASRRFRSDCLRSLPPLRKLPPEWERRAGSSQRSRQNAPLGRKRHLPRRLWLRTPRPLADIESLTSSFCRRRRCRISQQQSTWLSYRGGRLLTIRKKELSHPTIKCRIHLEPPMAIARRSRWGPPDTNAGEIESGFFNIIRFRRAVAPAPAALAGG
jgi:hypothetical protein